MAETTTFGDDNGPCPPVRYFMTADLTVQDRIAQCQVKVACSVEGDSPEQLTDALAGKLRAMADGFMQADAPEKPDAPR